MLQQALQAQVCSMDIIQNFLTENDCYNAGVHFVPQGIMVHSTATPGAMAKNFLSSWNKSFKEGEIDIQACVHFFVDDTGIYQTLPLDIRSWHAGNPANDMFLSFEICEPVDLNNKEYFAKVWKNAIDLCIWLTQQYNFDTDMIICHCEGYQRGWATNHADVLHWFPLHGKDMDMFRDEVLGKIHNNNGKDDEDMALVNTIMERTGKTEEEVVQALSVVVELANVKEDPWEKEGVQKLKDMGVINSDHDAREPIGFGSFGLMLERFKKVL